MTMISPDQTADLLDRMRQKAVAAAGPSVSTPVLGSDIAALIHLVEHATREGRARQDMVDTLESEVETLSAEVAVLRATPTVQVTEPALSPRSKGAQALRRVDVLERLVSSLAEIVESHPELMGNPPEDALNALFAQDGVFPGGAPQDMVEALRSVLSE